MNPTPLRRPSAAGVKDQHREEAALVERMSQGALEPLGLLYDRYAQDVHRFVYRATSSKEAADDITHDTFLTLFDVAERYDGEHSVRAFLIGIAAQLVRRRNRRLAQRMRQLTRFRDTVVELFERTPELDAASREQLVQLQSALARLREPKRLVFLLADVEGLSGKEIAAALGIPLATVWTRLHHARNELRRGLARAERKDGSS